MWIARDKSGAVYLYKHKPIKLSRHFVDCNGERGEDDIYLGEKEIYPELTWENSPKQVELKIIEETAAVGESPSKTFPRVNEIETGASYRH